MAILPNAPNCIEAVLKGTNQGTNWSNKIHFAATGALGSTTANLDTLAASIATAWGANIAALCNNAVFLTEIRMADLTTRTSPFVTHPVSPAVAGTRGTTVLPTSVACVISWNGTRRFRGGHGRIYIPAGVIADVTNGRLWNRTASEFYDDANTAAQAFWTALNGLSLGAVALDLVELSYYEGVPDPANPGHNHTVLRSQGVPFPTTGARVRTRVDTQRLRLGKETS